jgi:hypothetical protein
LDYRYDPKEMPLKSCFFGCPAQDGLQGVPSQAPRPESESVLQRSFLLKIIGYFKQQKL